MKYAEKIGYAIGIIFLAALLYLFVLHPVFAYSPVFNETEKCMDCGNKIIERYLIPTNSNYDEYVCTKCFFLHSYKTCEGCDTLYKADSLNPNFNEDSRISNYCSNCLKEMDVVACSICEELCLLNETVYGIDNDLCICTDCILTYLDKSKKDTLVLSIFEESLNTDIFEDEDFEDFEAFENEDVIRR